jgi:23S rRNA (uracil1939-C5)-methyltransferase
MQKLEKNQIISLKITGMTNEGNGVGHYGEENFAIFVPNTAPGDAVQIKLVKLLKNYGYGRLERIENPSQDRISSDCSISGLCGGCSLRHISYEAECRIKNGWIEECLKRLGGIHIPMETFQPSPAENRYRNKAQYPIGGDELGKIQIGFYAKRSHRIIDGEGCMLHPPIFSEIVAEVRDFLTRAGISPYDETSGKGLARHLYLRMGQVSGEVMVCLVINGSKLPQAEEFVLTVTQKFPMVSSIILNVNQKRGNSILGEKCITLWGQDIIRDILAGVEIELSPLSFYQVNHDAAEKLYGIVKEYAGLTGRETLLDLYCGAGTIGLSMADRCKRMIGVEIVQEAVDNAKENAQRNGIQNAEFFCADAGAAAAKFAAENIKADVVILDPPRKGCSQDSLQALLEIGPEKIVMVSCNPATLARDCKWLTEHGYQVMKIQGVDLFPRTCHVETIVLLQRGNL